VQVAAPLHEALEAIQAFGTLLTLTVPVLLVAASAGGYWISKRALDPVDEISRAAQRISIENLTERLPVPQSGDQLQRLTETLNQMFSRLATSVRQMKQFTADASHELRAPIALIRTTAEVAVQRRNRPSQEYLEALDDILAESEQMSQVINSLLLLARADAGKEHLEFAVLDAGVIVRGAADQGGKFARQKEISFAASLPDSPLLIQADGEALRRAILILLDNAVKYTPPGGHVQVRLQEENGGATISVQDTGIGIAPDDLPHVFDRFWRADQARSREGGGAGLGLSIARWIADQHRAILTVQSIRGQGSTFQLRLPVWQETGQQAEP
jgi:signal transduction histidine kinase